MSDKKYKSEVEKLKFEGKIEGLGSTRIQTADISQVKVQKIFKSFDSETTVIPTSDSISEFCDDLVNLSIDKIFKKVKPQSNKLTIDKMLNMLYATYFQR